MLQRIQTVYFFLSILSLLLVLLVSTLHPLSGNNEALLANVFVSGNVFLMITTIILIVSLVLNGVAISRFKQRKLQIKLADIVAALLLISLLLLVVSVEFFQTQLSYGVGIVFPIAALIFVVLAKKGVAKDDALIRSMDRLR